jgi:hypothetical protein
MLGGCCLAIHAKRRVGDDAAIPIVFAVDFDRRKTRRQRTARHHMLGPNDVRRRVEIDQLAASRIDAAEAKADVIVIRVDEVKIDDALERCLERRRIAEARCLDRARGLEERARKPHRVKAGHTEHARSALAHLLGQGAPGITFWQQGGEVAVEAQGRVADEFPKLAQLGDACLPGIAGDDGGVDRPDRDARDPIGVEVGLGQCFVDARLVGTERAATLQQKRDAVEGRPML